MKDMDLVDWLFAAFVLMVLITFLSFFVWAWRQASDKRECRQSGRMVVEDGKGEWFCAPVPAERVP